jgi:type I restriction enzyme S subunit
MTGSAGQKRVPTGYFALKPFPLPPLAEQKRIVAKVDALMALCDQLEAQQQARDTQQATLARAALARFADAPTPDNLNGLLNLPLSKNSSLKLHPSSFSSSSFNIHPSSLRKSILTLAVQGKLVPQDPEDETAKEDFPDWSKQEASQDDRPVPKNWITVPLGKLGKWTGGGTPSKSKPEYWNGTIPWVCPKDMKRPLIGSSIDTITKAAVDGSSAKAIQKGSLLMVVRGMILARDFPSAIAACEVTINQDMKSLYPDYPETNLYLHLALCAKKADFLDAVERSSHGTCKLLTKDLHAMEIPIPPMAEQGRIVTKVDQLMALVDELETQLAESRNSGQKVVEALVGELTAA